MITVSSSAVLPPTIPGELRQILPRVESSIDLSFESFPWNSLPGFLFCHGYTDKTKRVHTACEPTKTSVARGAERAVDSLNAMTINSLPLIPKCRYHAGYGWLSDGLTATDQIYHDRLAEQPGGEAMSELTDDMIASGEVRTWRMYVGVMVSGWSFEFVRRRHEDTAAINIYPVGEAPEGNEIHDFLRDLNTRVPRNRLRGATPAANWKEPR